MILEAFANLRDSMTLCQCEQKKLEGVVFVRVLAQHQPAGDKEIHRAPFVFVLILVGFSLFSTPFVSNCSYFKP